MTNRTKDHPPTRYLPPWPLGRGQERAPERLLVCREHPQRAGRVTTRPWRVSHQWAAPRPSHALAHSPLPLGWWRMRWWGSSPSP